ncbi:MAG TPA: hypothetical protein DCF33_05070 [Saprospirales bacterium]|nr:hypothetical protein [Saprospirales bacterium]
MNSMMRLRFLFLGFWLSLASLQAQFVCFSDSTTIYTFEGTQVPPMVGEATFAYQHYRVIVGGKFLDPLHPEDEAIYNCDMLIIDHERQKTYILPLSYFPPFVDDQFAGVNYAYTMENDTAYVLGGYGYDLAKGYQTTFPTLTIFPVKTLIDSVLHYKDYLNLFQVVESDSRLAITEGTLVKIGDYFLVYNGREITPIEEEFTDCLTVNEWDFRGQLRKFSLKKTEGYLEVDELQICNTSKVFYQCMPDTWKKAPVRVYELDRQ